jgi:hypothetical protein
MSSGGTGEISIPTGARGHTDWGETDRLGDDHDVSGITGCFSSIVSPPVVAAVVNPVSSRVPLKIA